MELIPFLREALSQTLPGKDAHRSFYPLREMQPIEKSRYIDTAVGIHIFKEFDTFRTILIEKSVFKGPHSGQMAFPGGKKEIEDLDLETTARRESFEEIGIAMNKGELLGKLTQVYIPVTKFCIHPYIFYHTSKPTIQPNFEVASYEVVRINDILKDELIGTTTIHHQNNMYLKNIPCFHLNQRTIWGATALILSELKEILKIPI